MAQDEHKVSIWYTLKDEASKGIGTLEGAIGSLGQKMQWVAVAGVGLLTASLYKAIDLWGQSEKQVAQLDQALKNGGNTFEGVSKNLQEYAKQMQKVSTFDDEAVMSAEAVFAQYGYTLDQIKKLTSATLDFASAKGMDAKSASELIARSIEAGTAIRGVGIEIDGAKGSAERIDSTLQGLSGTFGGQAKAEADTLSGSMKRLQNAFDDFLESIGQKIAPIFLGKNGIIQLLTDTIDRVNQLTGAWDKAKTPQQKIADQLEVINKHYKDKSSEEYKNAVAEIVNQAEAQAEIDQKKQEQMDAEQAKLAEIQAQKMDADKLNAELEQQKWDFTDERAVDQFNKLSEDEQKKVDLTKMTYDQLEKLEVKNSAQKAKLKTLEMQAFKGSLDYMAQGMQSNNATIFAIGKASATANATISAYEAFNKTLATYPFPLNIVFGALTLAVGMDQVSRIASTQMQLAEGGTFIADQTTPFNIGGQSGVFGEAGAEAVQFQPLDQGGSGGNISINIDSRPLAKHLFEVQKQMERTGEIDSSR